MKPELWKEIERIFNAAASIADDDERDLFVREQSADEETRAAIIRLLNRDRETDELLDQPILSIGEELFEATDDRLSDGENFGHYRILKMLGRGGMGVVYLAQDARLDRRIALKVLPASIADAPEIIARFRQEARAASHVSHASVAHIYEFDRAENRYYLAMEYVAGRTLRELLKDGSVSLQTATDIAGQIASALAAAHKAGIIHRDIKPENIVLTPDGAVKVLDFGLAKIEPVNDADARRTSVETVPGMIMGTAAYMSPEQVRGEPVDQTADLWSLAVVFYELLANERPFAGETNLDIMAAILRDEPKLEQFPKFVRIFLRRALQKKRSERFLSATEFIGELQNLRRRKNPGARIMTPRRRQTIFARRNLLIGFVALTLVCAAAAAIYFRRATPGVLQIDRIERITNSGKAKYTAVSKDGSLLAYSVEELGGRAIYLLQKNQIGTNFEKEGRVLVPATKNVVSQLVFAPDKKSLYFKMRDLDKNVGSLYRVDLGGGEPLKILDDLQGAPSFSPDGSRMTFFRLSRDNSRDEIIIADAATGQNQQVIYRRVRPEFIPDTAQPDWSPDGKTIICAGGTYSPETESYNVYAIDVAGGGANALLSGFWAEIWATAWIENGNRFVFTGHQEKLADNNQLWSVYYPTGAVTRLTSDYNDYYTISAARTGANTELMSIILQRSAQIYRAELAAANATASPLTAEGDHGYGLSVSGGTRIFYGSTKSGNPDVWAMNPDGTSPHQLTFDIKLDSQPYATADGKYVLFGSYRSGAESLWRMTIDGGEQTMLAANIVRDSLAVDPQSRYAYYRSDADGAGAVWRVPIGGGGAAQKLQTGNYKSLAVSPDGRWLAATVQEDDKDIDQLAILAVSDPAQPAQMFPLAKGALPLEKIRFTPDGRGVAYIVVQNGIGNIWRQPLGDNRKNAAPLTDFKSNSIYSFDFSPDGKQIFCARGQLNGYVIGVYLKR